MKRSKSVIAVALCATVCIGACVFAGCKTNVDDVEYVVSYLSTETRVYSSTAEVVEAVADSVVEITTETVTTQWGQQYITSGAGSGVIVGKSDDTYLIVTNNHVIEGANDITVVTRSGLTFDATLLATDDSEDIAVVTVSSETELPLAVWGDSDELQVGEDLIAIGNPLGSLGGTVTKGILSAKGRQITVGNYPMTLLQTDTAINPGNSGGGLFNMRGQLIGVVNAKTSDEEIEGICFAIPANIARDVYDDLVKYGYKVGRASFNIEVAQGTLYAGMGMGAQSQSIVYVTSETQGDGTTFIQYDRIKSINGKEITTLLEYNVALSELSPGDSVKIEVYRGTATGNSISFASEVTEFTVTAVQYGQ